jgi:maltoporin
MRRTLQALGISTLLVTDLLGTRAFALESPAADAESNPEESTPAAPPPPGESASEAAPSSSASSEVSAPPGALRAVKPKFGDVAVSGYFRAGFGASNQKGRMTCFALANPAGLVSKYRLGNECEVWSETHFTVVTYAGDDGSVAHLHFMPTIYVPTTYGGYSPTTTTSSPLLFTTSTGAVVAFPNLYADIKDIPWLLGGTAWAGTRYYKREFIYISDFFYWNPSGVGAGIEDVNLGRDLRLSYAAFAVDGEPVSADATSPPLPARTDFGVRNDLQLRGIRFWDSGEFQLGVQGIFNYSNNPATHHGWGATLQYVHNWLGGDTKVAVQYGRGGGTGFGTLARFYYPDFSVRHDLSEARLRLLAVFTIQPITWLGAQLAGVYQHDDNFLGSPGLNTDWYSAGGRVGWGFTKHAKLLVEGGYDRVEKSNGSDPQWLFKGTLAAAITSDQRFMARPEVRLFVTGALWNVAARTATVDSGRLYTDTNLLNGYIFGTQAETWW